MFIKTFYFVKLSDGVVNNMWKYVILTIAEQLSVKSTLNKGMLQKLNK